MREQGNSLLRMAEQLRVRTPLLCLALTIDGHVRKGRGGNNNTNKETRTLKESLPLLLKKRLFTKFQHVRLNNCYFYLLMTTLCLGLGSLAKNYKYLRTP